MKLDLYINEANDYARDIRVPILHPHVAIIHYDEVGEIRHSLNRIDCATASSCNASSLRT